MDHPRNEVIVASTLYLISSLVLDASPCACRIRAIVVHLERMMGTDSLDPVLRAAAIHLHAEWQRVAAALPVDVEGPTAHTWH